MNSELILIISNALTGIAAFFVGKRRTNAETDSVVLKNLELSINLYSQIIKDLKTEIESLNIKIQELEQKIQAATSLYIQYKKALDSYHKKGLPGAAQIMQVATQKLTAGDINYLDWVVLMNQSIQTRADYYMAVAQYNDAAFELEKLNTIQ